MKGIQSLLNAMKRNWEKLCCIVANTSEANTLLGAVATELTLQQVLIAIQEGQDFESKVVVDDNGNGTTYIEIRIWNPDTQSWEAPLYYLPGSNVGLAAGSLTAPINYINNGAIISQIYTELLAQGLSLDAIVTSTGLSATEVTAALINSNVVLGNITLNSLLTNFNAEDFATETTLADLNSKFNTLGQKVSAASHPVVLSAEQEIILNAIKTAVENLPKTATSVNTTGAGSVPIGASEISFYNNGGADATVNGTPLPAGVTRTFGFKNDIDTAIAYNGNGEQVLIDYMA